METPNTPSYRYPGSKPFEAQDYRLFKGRDDDIKNLAQKVLLQNLIVLYGRSGLGKSSLLNAGLLNNLKKDDSLAPLMIRLGAFLQGSSEMPLQKLQSIVSAQFPTGKTSFLYEKLIKDTPITSHLLWYFFKNIQIAGIARSTFVLIFDQFEELFTYPTEQATAFAKELSELFFVSVPQQLRNIITAKLQEEETGLTDDEFDQLYKPLHIKILFAIRSDKLSLLQNMATYFPAILQNYYELKPLSRNQAREAIEAPARLQDGNFISPPFTFTEDAIKLIIDELSSSVKTSTWQNSEDIETIQLQIVCKYAENIVIEKKLQEIGTTDLGNIKDILENYYRDFINSLPPESRLPARKLLEEKLIIDGVRVSMPVALILKDEGMTRALLDKLIAVHIVRPEQNDTVEIGHDTLIGPILRFYEERKKEEFIQNELKEKEQEIQKIKDAQQQHLAEQAERQKKMRRRNIRVAIIAALVVFAGITSFQWRQSIVAVHKAKAFMLSIQSQYAVNENPTIALNLAYEAVKLYPDTFIVNSAFDILIKNRFYKNVVQVQHNSFLSVSKDGRTIITSSPKGEDSVYDANGRLLHAFTQTSKLRSVDFSKDGKVLLMGSVNGDVELRKITGEVVKTIGNEQSPITTALFSPDEKTILVRVEKTGELKIISNNKQTKVFGDGFVICAVFSPDGTNVLTGSSDNMARLWTLKNNSTQSFGVWGGAIMSLSFINNNQFLVGSWAGIVSYFDLTKNNGISAELNNSDAVSAIAYTGDSIVYTGTYKGAVICWQGPLAGGGTPGDYYSKTDELKGHEGIIHSIIYDTVAKVIYSSASDCTVKRWTQRVQANSDAFSNKDKINFLNNFMRKGNVEPLTTEQQQQFKIK